MVIELKQINDMKKKIFTHVSGLLLTVLNVCDNFVCHLETTPLAKLSWLPLYLLYYIRTATDKTTNNVST